MRRDCLQLAKVAFKKDSKKEEEKTKRGFRGSVRLMWQLVVADVHVRRQVGE